MRKGLALAVLISLLGVPALCYAETTASALTSAPQEHGFSMLSWVHSTSIVEQLQTIHRYSQANSPEALMGLISALNSPYQLARRKAARSLMEKGAEAEALTREGMIEQIAPALTSKDQFVSKSILKLLVQLDVPDSRQAIKQFFQQADKDAQMDIIEVLAETPALEKKVVPLTQYSTYPEVRQIALEKVK